MPKIILALASVVLVVGLVTACLPSAEDLVPSQPNDDPPAGDLPADDPPADDPPGIQWEADGVITHGEYTGVQVYGDYEIHWASDKEYIYIGMRAKTSGWVAVGFDATPATGMANADMILGVVNGDDVVISDEFGTGPTTHNQTLNSAARMTSSSSEVWNKEDSPLSSLDELWIPAIHMTRYLPKGQ